MIDKKKNQHRLGKLASVLTAAVVSSIFTCTPVEDYCRASGTHYSPKNQFCFSGKPYPLCSDGEYNPLTQGCGENNMVGTRCADGSFVPKTTPCGGYTLSLGVAPAGGGEVVTTWMGAYIGKISVGAGDQVALAVNPAEGYRFVGWAGAQNNSSESIAFAMDGNKSLIAMFSFREAGAATLVAAAGEGGKVEIVGNSTGARSEATAEYRKDDTANVSAEPLEGYTFDRWSGSGGFTSASPSIKVKMDGSRTLVATFKPLVYTLTVQSNPEDGGTVFVNSGALVGTSNQDAMTRIEAIALPYEGYAFAGWTSGGAGWGANEQITFQVVDSGMTLVANFKRQVGGGGDMTVSPTYYKLETSVNPPNSGSVVPSPDNPKNYLKGDSVTVTATPAGGYKFVGWSGTGDAQTPSITIVMNAHKKVGAIFVPDDGSGPAPVRNRLTVNTNPSSGGTVSPTGGLFLPGEHVYILATPSQGCWVKGWAGAGAGGSTSKSVEITMNEDKNVTVQFECNTAGSPTTPTTQSCYWDGSVGCVPMPNPNQIDLGGDGKLTYLQNCNAYGILVNGSCNNFTKPDTLYYCYWMDAGECYWINNPNAIDPNVSGQSMTKLENCRNNGQLFINDNKCTGYKTEADFLYCDWGEPVSGFNGGCWPVRSQEDEANCPSGGLYTAADKPSYCPGDWVP